MKTTINCAASTVSLSVCAICHVWNVIQLLLALTADDRTWDSACPSAGLMLAYMAAVCVFNWCALQSGSRPYRRVAFVSTSAHLVCALLQGTAAQAMLRGSEGWLRYVMLLPAAINLPMGSAGVFEWTHSLLPWGSAMFFALNLAVCILRLRKVQGHGEG